MTSLSMGRCIPTSATSAGCNWALALGIFLGHLGDGMVSAMDIPVMRKDTLSHVDLNTGMDGGLDVGTFVMSSPSASGHAKDPPGLMRRVSVESSGTEYAEPLEEADTGRDASVALLSLAFNSSVEVGDPGDMLVAAKAAATGNHSVTQETGDPGAMLVAAKAATANYSAKHDRDEVPTALLQASDKSPDSIGRVSVPSSAALLAAAMAGISSTGPLPSGGPLPTGGFSSPDFAAVAAQVRDAATVNSTVNGTGTTGTAREKPAPDAADSAATDATAAAIVAKASEAARQGGAGLVGNSTGNAEKPASTSSAGKPSALSSAPEPEVPAGDKDVIVNAAVAGGEQLSAPAGESAAAGPVANRTAVSNATATAAAAASDAATAAANAASKAAEAAKAAAEMAKASPGSEPLDMEDKSVSVRGAILSILLGASIVALLLGGLLVILWVGGLPLKDEKVVKRSSTPLTVDQLIQRRTREMAGARGLTSSKASESY